MKSTFVDFTQGSIPKKMILYSLPIFFSNLLQNSFVIIDSLWIGNLLGAQALAATAISASVVMAILAFIIGINGATLTILSQQRGRNDAEGLKESLNAFVFVLGILVVLLGILGFLFSRSILIWLGTPEDVLPLATSYLRIQFACIPLLFGYNFIGTVLRAMGNSKAPVRFVMMAVLIHVGLSPILISVFDLGIEGAAIATLISQGSAFIYGLLYSIFKLNVPYSIPHVPAKRYIKAVLKLGLPGGLQMVAITSGAMFIMGIVASFGSEVLSGFAAAQRLDQLILLPAMTLGSVVNSMAGQNIGAGLWDRIGLITKSALKIILALSLIINTIIFFGAGFFIGLFVNEPGTIEFGTTYLKTVAFLYPFLSVNFILFGIIRSAGAIFYAMLLNLISFWVFRYPLVYLFSSWLGEKGIGIGMAISFILGSIATVLYFLLGNWRKAKVFDDPKEST